MPTAGHDRSDARRARRAAREPRLRAMREALLAVRADPGDSAQANRAAIVRELADRGVTDPMPEELNFLTDAITAPRRAGFRAVYGSFRGIARPLHALWSEMSVGSVPRWARTPDDVPHPPRDRSGAVGDGEAVTINLTPTMLGDGRATIARLLSDLDDQSEDGDHEQIRPLEVWVSLKSGTAVGVHVGKDQIAMITGPQTEPVGAAIRRWGKGTNMLSVDGDLLGATLNTAHLEMWVPTPIDR